MSTSSISRSAEARRPLPWSAEAAHDGGERTISFFDPGLDAAAPLIGELRGLGVGVSVHHDAFNAIVEVATRPPSLLVISSSAWGAQAVRLIDVARERFEQPVALAMARTDDPQDFATAIVAGLSPLLERPYRLDPLLTALRHITNRHQADALFHVGDLSLDATALSAHYRGRRIELSANEFAAMWLLAQRCGRGLTPLELSAVVWPDRGTTLASTRTLIRRLRVRLAEAGVPVSVSTVRGIGYRLDGCGVEGCEISSG